MRIEHIGICVTAPISMGEWYRDNLGFEIIQSTGNDVDGVSFVVDSEGETVLEFGKLPEAPPLDAQSLLPLQLHIAVECKDPGAEAERLVDAGAELVGESPRNSYKGERVLIRDPWGYTLQLVNRKIKLQTGR
jgi:catechol 2,3-dioxygenase-like lactoylglutathione lyase family enzyme